ncbi:MAG: hypothetical protein ACYDDF_06600 [Thermoplasmatota archaeon]
MPTGDVSAAAPPGSLRAKTAPSAKRPPWKRMFLILNAVGFAIILLGLAVGYAGPASLRSGGIVLVILGIAVSVGTPWIFRSFIQEELAGDGSRTPKRGRR